MAFRENVLILFAFMVIATQPVFAQSEAGEPTADSNLGTQSTESSTVSYHAGVFAGPLTIATDAKREVDKKGSIYGLALGIRKDFSNLFGRFETGFLVAQAKGSSDMTTGDQSVELGSPFLDLNFGYQIIPAFSFAVGFQQWLGKGGNFSPEDNSERNKLYYFVEASFRPEATKPFSFSLRYFKDVNIKDRTISAVTAGLNYQFPL